MQIVVDADACPVVGIVENIAKKYKIPVTLLCDTNQIQIFKKGGILYGRTIKRT